MVSHWSLTADAQVNSRPVQVEFVVDKVALAHIFLRVLQFPLSALVQQ